MTDSENSAERLRSFIACIERLEEETFAALFALVDIAAEIRRIRAAARDAGLNVKTIAETVRFRRMDPTERAWREALLDQYGEAG